MTMSLSARIGLQLIAAETSSLDLATTVRSTTVFQSILFTDGTGANQAEIVWSDSRTIAADDSDTLELANLSDDRGTVAMTAVKAIYVRNTGTVAIRWGGGDWGSAPLDDPESSALVIPAGGLCLLTRPSADGWNVPSGGDDIVFGNESESIEAAYDIVLIGEGELTS